MQLWFSNGYNIGVFNSGKLPWGSKVIVGSDRKFSIDKYSVDARYPTIYNGRIMEQAVLNVTPSWLGDTYNMGMHDCQGFAADLMKEYDRLIGAGAKLNFAPIWRL